MKHYTSSEARTHWFKILDEVAAGETVAVDRNGRRILLCCEETAPLSIPDYHGILLVDSPDEADRWTWDWEPDSGLKLRDTP
ncbi:MAG: hypothetical protein KF760_09725 [Candidatus Eremiobacteraeota bacterium]|nr:hypothetical protein [Candidatus Eremiobacteraeota bacterium]MCW5866308.1 hypothetical protein [Candidatus Eremiobacteraeota bacterium]